MTKQALLVQCHRAKNAHEGYARMEVTLGRKFVTQAREFARARKIPFWYFVQQALLAYAVTGNRTKSQQEPGV